MESSSKIPNTSVADGCVEGTTAVADGCVEGTAAVADGCVEGTAAVADGCVEGTAAVASWGAATEPSSGSIATCDNGSISA